MANKKLSSGQHGGQIGLKSPKYDERNWGTRACLENSKILKIAPVDHEKFNFKCHTSFGCFVLKASLWHSLPSLTSVFLSTPLPRSAEVRAWCPNPMLRFSGQMVTKPIVAEAKNAQTSLFEVFGILCLRWNQFFCRLLSHAALRFGHDAPTWCWDFQVKWLQNQL